MEVDQSGPQKDPNDDENQKPNENNTKKIKVPRKHTIKAKDLIEAKLGVAFKCSATSCFNEFMKKEEHYSNELIIRKLAIPKTVKIPNLNRKKKREISDILKIPQNINENGNTDRMETLLYKYFCREISSKYSSEEKKLKKESLNEGTFNEFFSRSILSGKKDLVEKLKTLTIRTYYDEVFIKGKNIFGEKYEDIFNNIKTLEKIIEEKKEKNLGQGFDDESYVEKFWNIAIKYSSNGSSYS